MKKLELKGLTSHVVPAAVKLLLNFDLGREEVGGLPAIPSLLDSPREGPVAERLWLPQPAAA